MLVEVIREGARGDLIGNSIRSFHLSRQVVKIILLH